jgi:DNA-directed RNA polymerase subunit K/omega
MQLRRKNKMAKAKKVEGPKLNKFEKTRLLSARAEEIAAGDKPNIKIADKNKVLTQDYVKIAQKEFDEDKLDLEVKKY